MAGVRRKREGTRERRMEERKDEREEGQKKLTDIGCQKGKEERIGRRFEGRQKGRKDRRNKVRIMEPTRTNDGEQQTRRIKMYHIFIWCQCSYSKGILITRVWAIIIIPNSNRLYILFHVIVTF